MADRVLSNAQRWVVYCDGSAVPNPGRMGLGAVLIDPDGTRHTLAQATGLKGCNNEAELRALMAALGELRKRGATAVLACCDSSIVVEQLIDPGAKPIARLASLFEEARAMLQSFNPASLQWIPRHRNGEADALARSAQGMPPKPAVKSAKNRRADRNALQLPGTRLNELNRSIPMAQLHTPSGQVVSVLPLGDQLRSARTTAILKAEQLEIVRVVLLAGNEMKEHKAPGEITVQCIEGRIEFRMSGTSRILEPGDLIHLLSLEPHALRALTDSSALVTMRVSRQG